MAAAVTIDDAPRITQAEVDLADNRRFIDEVSTIGDKAQADLNTFRSSNHPPELFGPNAITIVGIWFAFLGVLFTAVAQGSDRFYRCVHAAYPTILTVISTTCLSILFRTAVALREHYLSKIGEWEGHIADANNIVSNFQEDRHWEETRFLKVVAIGGGDQQAITPRTFQVEVHPGSGSDGVEPGLLSCLVGSDGRHGLWPHLTFLTIWVTTTVATVFYWDVACAGKSTWF